LNNINNENEICDKLERLHTNSFSSNSETNKIDKQNYILESEINLSKPIAIKNILNASGTNNNNREEDSQQKTSLKGLATEKNKFSRSKIKDFIKEKILKNKISSDAISQNNNYKNLYQNLKFNYSDFENDNINNQKNFSSSSNANDNDKYGGGTNENQIKKQRMNYNNNNNLENEVDYETDPEDLRKIDEVIKREVNLHSPKSECRKSSAFNNKNSSFEVERKDSNKINFNKLSVPVSNTLIIQNSANLIDVNATKIIKQNKQYNNLVEEELDAEASSNTDEENMSDFNSNNNSLNSSGNKKYAENLIVTKINQLENNNDITINNNNNNLVNNINSSSKRKSFEFISKTSSNKNNININRNLLGEFEDKSISNDNNNNDNKLNSSRNASEFPKFEEIFGEKIETETEKQKKTSLFGNFETFTLFKVIVKNGEDLRQEQFATQLINEFHQIFKMEKVDCWVNTYEILATGNNAGLIEVVPNSISLDQLKRKAKGINSLRHFFEVYYGLENGKRFKSAMKNFICSLAGYSLVCYFLQIKDRHNANILIDDTGHLIHIDFGFMFTNAPGKGLKFEKAPFKLTKEFVDVMGGVNSKNFQKFRKLLWK